MIELDVLSSSLVGLLFLCASRSYIQSFWQVSKKVNSRYTSKMITSPLPFLLGSIVTAHPSLRTHHISPPTAHAPTLIHPSNSFRAQELIKAAAVTEAAETAAFDAAVGEGGFVVNRHAVDVHCAVFREGGKGQIGVLEIFDV